MNLETYGKLFRMLGLGVWARMTTPRPNVRVTFTHEVKSSDLDNFDSLIGNIGKDRTFITPGEFFACWANGFRPARNSVLMTFDDGLMSSYHAAKKVLNPRGIKAVFFVPTRILDLKTPREMRQFVADNVRRKKVATQTPDEDDYLLLSSDALLDLAADGHTIFPHTHSHVDLKDIRDDRAAELELVRPRRILEDLLHTPMEAMAFPVGTERQADAFAYRKIRETYRFCFTALNGANTARTDPYYIHRDCLPPDSPWSYMAMVMNGTYDAYYRIKMRRLKKCTIGKR